MNQLLDNWLPWLADLLELGGPILGMILLIALGIWALLFERTYVLLLVYPRSLANAQQSWWQRLERTSWFGQQQKNDMVSTLGSVLTGNFSLISTLI